MVARVAHATQVEMGQLFVEPCDRIFTGSPGLGAPFDQRFFCVFCAVFLGTYLLFGPFVERRPIREKCERAGLSVLI